MWNDEVGKRGADCQFVFARNLPKFPLFVKAVGNFVDGFFSKFCLLIMFQGPGRVTVR